MFHFAFWLLRIVIYSGEGKRTKITCSLQMSSNSLGMADLTNNDNSAIIRVSLFKKESHSKAGSACHLNFANISPVQYNKTKQTRHYEAPQVSITAWLACKKCLACYAAQLNPRFCNKCSFSYLVSEGKGSLFCFKRLSASVCTVCIATLCWGSFC